MARARIDGKILKRRVMISPCDSCLAKRMAARIINNNNSVRINPKVAFFRMEGMNLCHECYENWKKP